MFRKNVLAMLQADASRVPAVRVQLAARHSPFLPSAFA